jgi:hypothetical protein
MKTTTSVLPAILATAMLIAGINGAAAQMDPHHQMMQGGAVSHPNTAPMPGVRIPTLPGQDAFGAIQEIIGILESDPTTDWSRVDISGLRSHLVDMNRLVITTEARETKIDGGLEIVISGKGQTLRAIQAMVPEHALTIDGLNGWTVKGRTTATGAELTVTATSARETAHIRALGFYGLMASGGHHQPHHLALARGRGMHAK